MQETDLEGALQPKPCPRCGIARQRPTLVQQVSKEGEFVLVDCRNPHCTWRGRAKLPPIRKTLIYLDSSVVSHIARAVERGDTESEWGRLYAILRDAAAKEVISCPASHMVEEEATLASSAAAIIELSRKLGGSELAYRSRIEEAQVFRAFRRFLAGKEPIIEVSPPTEDAFEQSPHRWQEAFRFSVDLGRSGDWVQNLADTKERVLSGVSAAYERYRDEGLGFEDIRTRELGGFGKGQIEMGDRSVEAKLRCFGDPSSFSGDLLILSGMTLFEKLAVYTERRAGLPLLECYEQARDFLVSEHVAGLASVDINATLHAAVAWAMQGKYPRNPSASDSADIAHLSICLPYFDVFIADRFFASVCNAKPCDLAKKYGTVVVPTGEVEGLMELITSRVAETKHVALVERVHASIQEGGYPEEEQRMLDAYMRARGWDAGVSDESGGAPSPEEAD